MKIANNYLAMLLIVTSLMGCEEHKEQLNDKAYPLSIGAVDLEEVTTRGVKPLDISGATIKLGTINQGAIDKENIYAYDNDTWHSATEQELIVPSETPIYAYYPYDDNINDETQIPLTSALYKEKKDICYAYTIATSDANNGNTHANLVLKHSYSQITFKFVVTADYKGSTILNEISLYKAKLNASAILNIVGSTPIYTNKSGSVTVNPNINIKYEDQNTCSILMVPTETLSSDIDVAIIDQKNKMNLLTIPLASLPNNKLEAGKNYQATVNVGTSGMSISSVSVAEWTTENESNTNVDCAPEANCYIVMAKQSINIPVSRVNTVALARGETPPLQLGVTKFTAGVLWSYNQDKTTSVPTVTPDITNGVINVKINTYPAGNTVIFIKKEGEDKILWTWHIWTPRDDAEQNTYKTPGNGYVWMDRDLGAFYPVEIGFNFHFCGGLKYQWGRKDPFPGSNGQTIGNAPPELLNEYTVPTKIENADLINVPGDTQVKRIQIGTAPITYESAFKYSVQNPLVFFTGWAGSTAKKAGTNDEDGGMYSWYSSDKKKTLYDPCPPGWKVPPLYNGSSPWAEWTKFTRFISATDAYTTFTDNVGNSYGNYPASGYRNNLGQLIDIGSYAVNWAAEIKIDDTNSVARYIFVYNTGKEDVFWNRDFANSVRCIKE